MELRNEKRQYVWPPLLGPMTGIHSRFLGPFYNKP